MSPTPIQGPVRLSAEAYRRSTTSGRNRALILTARTPTGQSVQCVVKVPGLMESPRHPLESLLEWLGAAIARELRVVVPAPHLVAITGPFVAAVGDPQVRAGLQKSIGCFYGSEFVDGAPMSSGPVADTLRHDAATLLGFDVFIHNIDRRTENPNLLQRPEALVAIDHGDAFAFLVPSLVPGPRPETDPLRFVVLNHPCTPTLRRWRRLEFSTFRERLALLTDARLDELRAATPAEWVTETTTKVLDQILDTLRQRRDAVEEWLPEVEACLRSP